MEQPQPDFFKDPPAAYRIIPFWFWNGDMSESEISFQIAEMAAKGVGGIFICARQGLEIPYLSALWFERVAFAVETARHHGLEVWFYDEYPYPSGMSGGEVILQHPEARQHNLLHMKYEVAGPGDFIQELPWARVLFARAFPLNPQSGEPNREEFVDLRENIGNLQVENVFQKTGLTAYNRKRYFTAQPTKFLTWQVPAVPAGRWQIEIFVEKEIEAFKFFGTFFDPCNAKAVRTFIKTTHERYLPLLKKLPGQVRGIFSDEVGLYGNPPWSPQLPAFFETRTGYSLLENLTALQYPAGENTARFRYDYFQSLHLLLRGSYHQQVKEWCQAHNLQYVAEVPAVRMTTQLHSDTPGGDSAHEKLGRSLDWIIDRYALNLRSNPRMVSSLARQLGRDRAMIECFHSVGWSMTLQDARWMLDRLAAMGIDFFNFHAFFYSLDGLRKHDAPPSQFLQNPYWPHFKQLTDYAGRLSYFFSQGRAVCEIAVLDPTTSLWTHLGNPLHEFGYTGSDAGEEKRLEQLKADWAAICKALTLNQFDYDHLDPELLAQGQVTGEGKLEIGKAVYSALILPPLTNLEAAAWEKIKEFLEKGGSVISLGSLPYEQIEPGSKVTDEVQEWFGSGEKGSGYWQTEKTASDRGGWIKGKFDTRFKKCPGGIASNDLRQLVSFLNEQLFPPVTLVAGEPDRKSLLTHRRLQKDGSYALFVSNQEGREITVRANAHESLGWEGVLTEEMNLETGEISIFPAGNKGEPVEITLAPYQARLFRFSEAWVKGVQPEPSAPFALAIEAGGEWRVKALESNAARFGRFKFALDLEDKGLGEGWQNGTVGEDWPQVETKTLIDQLDDLARAGKIMLPLSFSQTFGTPIKLSLAFPLVCWYKVEFEIAKKPGNCRLRMDVGAVSGNYSLWLNGHPLDPARFEAVREYDICNRSLEVGTLLVEGTNTLVARVEAQREWDGLLDALYLTGDFGVYAGVEGRLKLELPPENAFLTGKPGPGFPFYAGTLAYSKTFNLAGLPQKETFELSFEGWDANLHDCVEVLLNGQSLGVKPWTPYSWQGRSEILEVGENDLEVRVTNTLVGLLEGKYFDYADHQLLDVEVSRQG